MNGLDLYSKIEQYLDFSQEIRELHKYFLIQLLENNIKTCLDIGCGQGEFLEILKLNGINGFGIDLSSSQIKFAKQRGVNASCIDLCNLDKLNNQYDCAVATFDVINYIDIKNLKNFFKCAYNTIKDGGYFIFDVNSLFGFEEVAVGTLSINNDNNFINIDANFEDNILKTDITYFEKQKNGNYKKEESFIEQYYYSNQLLVSLLKEVGFKYEKIEKFYLHTDEEADKEIYFFKKIK